MYTSGFLGQLNAMIAGAGGYLRAGTMALGLTSMTAGVSGCGGEDGQGQEATIPPIDQPDPIDTTPPDRPQVNMDLCLPADASGIRLRILVEGMGASLGDASPIDGSFRMAMPSGALTILSSSDSDQIRFRGRLKWDNVPSEWETVNPDEAIGPLGLLTQARLDGRPLTDLNMTRSGISGPWADQFPNFEDAGRVGFSWWVDEGILHFLRDSAGQVSDCALEMTIRAHAQTASGFGPPLDYGVLPFYAPRTDGETEMAEADFSNETVVILEGAMEVRLPASGEPQEICNGDCLDVTGAANPGRVQMSLLPNSSTK